MDYGGFAAQIDARFRQLPSMLVYNRKPDGAGQRASVKYGLEDIAPPLKGCVAFEFKIAKCGTIGIATSMPPGPNEKIAILSVTGVFQRTPSMNGPPHILLVV
jgi:hypothetical protein